MIEAYKVGRKVGTAAGTTTLVLSGVDNNVQCPTPAAMAFQVQSLGPPSDFNWMRPSMPWWQKWWGKTSTPPPATVATDPAARLPNGYAKSIVYDPYADRVSLQGAPNMDDDLGFIGRLKRLRRPPPPKLPRPNLGLILAPYGDISPQLYSEIADIENNVHYQCAPFDPQYNTRGDAGFYYDTPLGGGFAKHGIVGQALAGPTPPTDLQLSRIYGYTPVVNTGAGVPGRYIDRPGQTWTAAPYVPPNGGGGYGTWGPPLRGARRTFFGRIKNALNLGDGDVPLPEGGVMAEDLPGAPNDPSTLALRALNKHQDRMFLLGIVSTGAVALTTAHNLLKDRRNKRSHSHATVTTPMSGARRRRKRRG